MSCNESSDLQEGNASGFQIRQTVLELDLNFPFLEENTSSADPATTTTQYNETLQLEAINDSEAFDDVVVISPRKFEEARNNASRNHYHRRHRVIEGCDQVNESHNFGRSEATRYFPSGNNEVDLELSINVQDSKRIKTTSIPATAATPSKESVSREPTFICTICMDQLSEETSTKCGHIFCKKCIKAAITAQQKCPTCRRKLKMRDIIRVYLPSTE